MRAWPLVVALAACGGGSTQTIDGPATGSDSGTDSAIPPGWTKLISTHWQLSPAGTLGEETYWCNRMMVTQDMWISGFRALAPAGTHHARLTIDPTSTTKTGEFTGAANCNDTIGFDQNSRLVYASGLDTNDLLFPAGIAVHLTAGQYITLEVHLLNTSDFSEMDESGVLVQTVDQSQVSHEIDATFVGTRSIVLPVDATDHYFVGGCTAPHDWHVFAVWPHMHKFGVHAKLLADSNNVTTTVLDQPFDFTAEKTYPMNETVIHTGDSVTARCDYIAGPAQTCAYPSGACTYGSCSDPDGICRVSYGETAGGEMCYVAMYKYPAGDVPAYGCHP